jgi:hypothetical protein
MVVWIGHKWLVLNSPELSRIQCSRTLAFRTSNMNIDLGLVNQSWSRRTHLTGGCGATVGTQQVGGGPQGGHGEHGGHARPTRLSKAAA